MTVNEKKTAWLAGASHFITHGYMTLLPAVLVVLAGEQSLGFFALGAIVNVGYFLFGLGSIPSGVLTDRLGSKRMLVLGLFGTALSSILVGLSPNSAAFAMFYSLLGLSASIYHPAGLSLIARHIEKRGKALGLHGVMGNIGLSVAPLFAGVMVMLFDTWRAAYFSFGLLGIALAAVAHKTRIEGEEELSLKELFSGKISIAPKPVLPATDSMPDRRNIIPVSLLLLYLGSILFGFVYRGSLTFFPALFQNEVYFIASSEQPVVLAGLVTSVILSIGMIGQWFGGYLSDKFKRPETGHIIIYLAALPAIYFMSRLTDSRLIAASAIFSLVFYGWQPIQNSLIARHTSHRSHGKGYGLNFFLIMGMGSMATAVGGYIMDERGVDQVYFMLAVVMLAALLISFSVVKAGGYSIRYGIAIEKDNK